MSISILLTFQILAQEKRAGDLLIISGGGDPTGNNERYYWNIERAQKVFEKYRKTNIVADGKSGKGNNYVLNSPNGYQKRDKTGLLKMGQKKASQITGGIYGMALKKTIKKAFNKKVSSNPNVPLVVYVTDHGSLGDGPNKRVICLWNGEVLTVDELRRLVHALPPEKKVMLINDQCFGGGMLQSLWKDDVIRKNSCGFAASTAFGLAFGGGGLMESFLEAKEGRIKVESFLDAYENMKERSSPGGHLKVKFGKAREKVFSAPISTSEIFIKKYLASKKVGKMDLEDLCIPKEGDISKCLGDLKKPVRMLLLKKKLETIKKRLQLNARECTASGAIPSFDQKNVDYQKLKGELDDRDSGLQRKYKRMEQEFVKINSQYKLLLVDYFSKLPKIREYEDLKKEVAQMTKKLQEKVKVKKDFHITYEKKKKLLHEKYLLYKDAFKAFNRTVIRIFKDINSPSLPQKEKTFYYKMMAKNYGKVRFEVMNSFFKYLKEHKKTQVLLKYKKAKEDIRSLGMKMRICRKFYDRFTTYAGIKAMLANKDIKNLATYLDILECENTKI